MRYFKYTSLFYEKFMDGLGFCLSAQGDLLSQWRGYAADGSGVSIGFSADYLQKLAEINPDHKGVNFSLQEIEYEPGVHNALVEPLYNKIKQLIDKRMPGVPFNKAYTNSRPKGYIQQKDHDQIMIAKFRLDVPEFQEILFRLKSPAFREEQEWRLLLFTHNKTQSFLYRAKQNCIIPYLKIALMGLTCSPIVEVILGPKHITPLEVIQKFLEQNDYSAKVTPSAASYR